MPTPELSGEMAGETHVLPIRIYYEDTDFSGFVYHASYLRFLERGRSDHVRHLGVHQGQMFTPDTGHGVVFVVRAMTLDFLRPARVDEIVTVQTTPEEIRGASITLNQKILRGQELLVSARVKVACVSDGRACRLPEPLRIRLMQGVAPC